MASDTTTAPDDDTPDRPRAPRPDPAPPGPGSGTGPRKTGARGKGTRGPGPRRTGARGSGRRGTASRGPGARRAARWAPYAYVAPFFALFGAFGLFPLLYTGWASLHRVELTAPSDMEWVGLRNYSRLLTDEFFHNALGNTVTIGVLSTVPQLLMALGIAHLLHHRLRGSLFFRVVALTPYATSVAAATLVFVLLFGRDYGLVNWVLGLAGVGPVDWQNGTWASRIAVSTIVVWRWTGYNALIYLAALQAVPGELYEAAALDGASRWRQFAHVTVPSLRPTILFTCVVSTIGATQLFGEPLLYNGSAGATGGSEHQFQTLGLYLYEQGWVNLHLGRASAIAWTMFLILVLLGTAVALTGAYRRRRAG